MIIQRDREQVIDKLKGELADKKMTEEGVRKQRSEGKRFMKT